MQNWVSAHLKSQRQEDEEENETRLDILTESGLNSIPVKEKDLSHINVQKEQTEETKETKETRVLLTCPNYEEYFW